MLRTRIIGSGVCLPPYGAKNEDIAAFFPTPPDEKWTPAWVERRLGIRERRNCFDFRAGTLRPGCYDGDLAFHAARAAMENAGVAPEAIDRVIYTTSTPEYLIPDPACALHLRLGLRPSCAAIGTTAVGCGGFIYGLDMADSEIRAGKCETVLVTGSVSIGPYIAAGLEDPEERQRHLALSLPNAYIFGEGAGALIFRATEADEGVLATYAGASGVELTRFRGHPIVGAERSVHDAEEPSAVPAGISATHR